LQKNTSEGIPRAKYINKNKNCWLEKTTKNQRMSREFLEIFPKPNELPPCFQISSFPRLELRVELSLDIPRLAMSATGQDITL
jgi:hypothetical protein